jgi:predicted metal-binding protein
MKVGIIRCQQTEDMCPGTTDFKVAAQGKLAFEETGVVEITGFVSCGGYPGKRAVERAKIMVDCGCLLLIFSKLTRSRKY